MLAKLLTLSLLGLATLSAADIALLGDIEDVRVNVTSSYTTVEGRLLSGVKLHGGPSYRVRAGQCAITLTSREMCGVGLVVASLEVTVINAEVADIMFEMRDHNRVRIELPFPCLEDWYVNLRLACLRRKLSRGHVTVPFDV